MDRQNEDMLQAILQDVKIGWWKADTARRMFLLSDGLRDAAGFPENEVTFDRFVQSVGAPYRAALSIGLAADLGLFASEQVFSLLGPAGEQWFRWKLLRREGAPGSGHLLSGYAQQVDTSAMPPAEFCSVERMNSLLYRLNNISHTLLSFLHTDTIDRAIDQVLTDILKMFHGSRAYIARFDWEQRIHVYAYEVTAKGVESAKDQLSHLSTDDTPWWIEQLDKGCPVILSTLDDLPPEAFREREVLAAQNIRSLFVLPMISHEKLWGYAGIDVVEEHRVWSNEDYQWFASLVNIINICVELQRSKQEAQTERDYLQNLYRYMPLGYVRLKMLYDSSGKPVDYLVLDSNYAAEAIVEQPQSSYVGRSARDLGLDLTEYLPSLEQTLRAKHYISTETRLPEVGKHVHTVMYSIQSDEVVCLMSDTTEMHTIHQALDRSEKLLRNIYDNIPVGIELYDKHGQMLDLNKKDMEIFGIRRKEDVVGRVNFFRNPNVPEEIWRRVQRGEEFAFKLYYPFDHVIDYYPTAKKGYIEIYTSVSMLYDAQGELINFLLINIDNTEINRAHSRIAEFESSFSLVSRFGRVGYCRFDLITKEGYAVPQWYHNLGEEDETPLDQVIGVYSHVDPSDRAAIMESIRRVKADQIDSFSHDLRVDAGGEEKWTRINVIRNPLNNDPAKIEMVCVNYDVTELKQTEKHLIEAKNKAEVSDRLKSAFLANMSHEIRTPLNAIVGFSNLLAECDDAAERSEYMHIVQENNDLLLKLISDILDLSKIEAGTLEFHNASFDVNAMCQEIVRSLAIRVQNKPVELRFGEHLPACRLVSDKTRLTQVLTNFINNALKFTAQGHITLGYRQDDEHTLTFYVQDTGAGIPASEQEAVFGRFVKLNSFVQGTGLGLAISKSIVEQLGGRIGLHSEEGKGSCFWFTHPYTPVCDAETEAGSVLTAENPQAIAATGKRPVILIAEDTESNFLLLSLILRKEFEVLRAHDGAEAVRLCREAAPDAILMDIRMPGMDGLEATRRIRRENPTVPILAITAFAFDSDRQKALDAGCNDYLAKPIAGDVLKKKLRRFLCR